MARSSLYSGLLCLVMFLSCAGAARAQVYDDKTMDFQICNKDAENSVAVAFADKGLMTTTINGWWSVAPGRCKSVPRETSRATRHNLFFAAGHTTMVEPHFGGDARPGDSFCIDPTADFDLFESFARTPGRTTACQGNEKLVQSPLQIEGEVGAKFTVEVPPFTESSRAAESGGGGASDTGGSSWKSRIVLFVLIFFGLKYWEKKKAKKVTVEPMPIKEEDI